MVDAWTVLGLGCWPPSTSHTWVSFLVTPPCSSFLHFLRFNQLQTIRIVVFTTEKNPSTSGLVQFKPVLFKDQLYIKSLERKKSLDWKFCKNSEIFHSQSVLSCLKLYKLYKISWEVFPLPVFSREVCSVLGWSSRTRRRQWHPTPLLLPGKSHGWRSLVGCSPWGCKELDMTEQLNNNKLIILCQLI